MAIWLTAVHAVVVCASLSPEPLLAKLFADVQALEDQGEHAEALALLRDADKLVTRLKHEIIDQATSKLQKKRPSSQPAKRAGSSQPPSRCGDFSVAVDHSKEGLRFTEEGGGLCHLTLCFCHPLDSLFEPQTIIVL